MPQFSHPIFYLTGCMRLLTAICFGLLCLCSPAQATDQRDIATGLKTLLLLTDKMAMPATVAVLYDPTLPDSQEDAETIKNDIENGIGVPGELTLKAQLTSVEVFSPASSAKIAFVAQGLAADSFDRIGRAAAAAGILTMSVDMNCVRANKCVLGIVTRPRVEIDYSPAAAQAAHIVFAPAFIMLAKQIEGK